ncbi:MAG: hypothetical protein R3F43_29820 [bacterium]
MIGIALNALKVGDIIVDRAPNAACHPWSSSRRGTIPASSTWTPDRRARPQRGRGNGGELFAFRMRHNPHVDVDAVRTLVGTFARAWAGQPTYYGSFPSNQQVQGANRFQGTQAARQSGIIPPLAYDALFRILKWATRAERVRRSRSIAARHAARFFWPPTRQRASRSTSTRPRVVREDSAGHVHGSAQQPRGPARAPGPGVQLTDARMGWQHTFQPNQALIQNSNRGSSQGPSTMPSTSMASTRSGRASPARPSAGRRTSSRM